MKKNYLLLFLLSTFFANAKVCSVSCANNFGSTIVGYGYAWTQSGNGPCSRPTNCGEVAYAVAMNSPGTNNQTVIIDQGTTSSCSINC